MKRRRVYSPEFKREALALWAEGERSSREIEDELGISRGLLQKWKKRLKNEGPDAFPGQGRRSAYEEEIAHLRHELAVVTQERDILKKALAIFAHHP